VSEKITRSREPLSPDQVVSHCRPSLPQVSPDGQQILYTVRQISKPEDHPTCSIWKASVSGGEPQQFTSGIANDEEPRWSPDGTRIAFLSDRSERGKQTVYVIPSSGGEAIRAFEHEGDMDTLSWSPDGSVLSVLMTEPETEHDKEKREERRDWKVWDTDYKYQRLWVIDPSTKKGRCVSPVERQVLAYGWSPDSQSIAISSTATPMVDDVFKTTDLSIISRHGGEPSSLFQPYAVASDPVWSSDGSKIAWIGPAGRVANGDVVYARSLEGGEAVCLTPDLAGTVESIAPINHGESLLVQVAEGMHSAIYQLDWDGQCQSLVRLDSGSFPMPATTSVDGSVITAIWESGSYAPDVWIWKKSAPFSAQRCTHLNKDLEQAAIGTSEVVSWSNGEGDEIHGMLFKPCGYKSGRAYPLVVQVHGGPTSRWADEFTANWHDWAHSLAGRGFCVLMPNPRGSTGRGSEFSNAIFQDVAGGEFRDMMTGVDAMIERGIADPDRLGIGGWSWGGFISAWTITQTDRFKAAIVGAGLPNMVSDNGIGDIPSANLSYFEKSPYEDPESYWSRSPIRYLSNVKTPTLILHGEEDRRVAMAQGLELYTGLKSLGVKTQFVTYPREPHAIIETNHQRDLIERVVAWFSEHLID
jgi:dipeptidyl aminopeptidase/acylaminoacyl peptidase